jgi:hypothetical protein
MWLKLRVQILERRNIKRTQSARENFQITLVRFVVAMDYVASTLHNLNAKSRKPGNLLRLHHSNLGQRLGQSRDQVRERCCRRQRAGSSTDSTMAARVEFQNTNIKILRKQYLNLLKTVLICSNFGQVTWFIVVVAVTLSTSCITIIH